MQKPLFDEVAPRLLGNLGEDFFPLHDEGVDFENLGLLWRAARGRAAGGGRIDRDVRGLGHQSVFNSRLGRSSNGCMFDGDELGRRTSRRVRGGRCPGAVFISQGVELWPSLGVPAPPDLRRWQPAFRAPQVHVEVYFRRSASSRFRRRALRAGRLESARGRLGAQRPFTFGFTRLGGQSASSPFSIAWGGSDV